MARPNGNSDESYRQKFFAAATYLYKALRYLVFVYVLGSALAVVVLALTSGTGHPTFSLALVLGAYGVAGLAGAVFLYAFVQLLILACCAYGEWLCEQKEEARRAD